MATAVVWPKPQMATSTPRPTATSTKTPEAAGTRLRALPTTPQATPEPALRPPTAIAERKRAAAPQPGAAEAAAVGNPGRIVPEVRQAGAGAVAGAVAGNATRAPQRVKS